VYVFIIDQDISVDKQGRVESRRDSALSKLQGGEMGAQKVLLVDDTKMMLEIIKSFLANSPVQVFTAQNGKEALDVCRKERPDVVVLDQNMPIMTGMECCETIRKDLLLKKVRIIMMSSRATPEDRYAFEQAGCDDFLAKPLERKLFLAKMHSFLSVVEQREARVPCRAEVLMGIAGTSISGISENISMHGLYIATDFKVSVESEITLRFKLPGKTDNPLITAKGRIVWLNCSGSLMKTRLPPGFGVEILDITGGGLAILRKNEIKEFVETYIKK
jgi:DNA-binding response OmpR family regulator